MFWHFFITFCSCYTTESLFGLSDFSFNFNFTFPFDFPLVTELLGANADPEAFDPQAMRLFCSFIFLFGFYFVYVLFLQFFFEYFFPRTTYVESFFCFVYLDFFYGTLLVLRLCIKYLPITYALSVINFLEMYFSPLVRRQRSRSFVTTAERELLAWKAAGSPNYEPAEPSDSDAKKRNKNSAIFDKLVKDLQQILSKDEGALASKALGAAASTALGAAGSAFEVIVAKAGASGDPWLKLIEGDGQIHHFDNSYIIRDFVKGDGFISKDRIDEIKGVVIQTKRPGAQPDRITVFYENEFESYEKTRTEFMSLYDYYSEANHAIPTGVKVRLCIITILAGVLFYAYYSGYLKKAFKYYYPQWFDGGRGGGPRRYGPLRDRSHRWRIH